VGWHVGSQLIGPTSRDVEFEVPMAGKILLSVSSALMQDFSDPLEVSIEIFCSYKKDMWKPQEAKGFIGLWNKNFDVYRL